MSVWKKRSSLSDDRADTVNICLLALEAARFDVLTSSSIQRMFELDLINFSEGIFSVRLFCNGAGVMGECCFAHRRNKEW